MKDRPEGRRPYRGRRPSAARVRFLELLDAGVRPLEASREVGVNERTGRDWAKGIVKSSTGRYTFGGVLVWSAPTRPKPLREERVISARFCRWTSGSRSPTCIGRACRSVRSPGG